MVNEEVLSVPEAAGGLLLAIELDGSEALEVADGVWEVDDVGTSVDVAVLVVLDMVNCLNTIFPGRL